MAHRAFDVARRALDVAHRALEDAKLSKQRLERLRGATHGLPKTPVYRGCKPGPTGGERQPLYAQRGSHTRTQWDPLETEDVGANPVARQGQLQTANGKTLTAMTLVYNLE